MDSFELNKIAGAVLFALLVSFGLSIFSDIIFATEAPEAPGYVIAVAEETGAEDAAADAGEAAAEPIGVLLASADAAAGEASARKCAACHSFGEGEANKVGPNLYDVVGHDIASKDYAYSESMTAYAGQAGSWTFEHLSDFLQDPKGTVPGTKMAFAGLRDDSERANVIAYLRSLSGEPVPLPEASAAAEAPEEAPEAEAAAAAEPPAAAGDGTAETAAQPAEGTEPAAEEVMEPAGESAGEQVAEAPPAAAPADDAGEAAPQAAADAQPAAAGGEADGFTALIAAADVAKGQAFSRRCGACHSFDQGGPNKIGPNLWDVVGRPVAAVEGFQYSEAMEAFSEGGAKAWTYAELDAFLADPKQHVPGNKMAFPGIKKDEDRAGVVAYLRTLSESPQPLPGE